MYHHSTLSSICQGNWCSEEAKETCKACQLYSTHIFPCQQMSTQNQWGQLRTCVGTCFSVLNTFTGKTSKCEETHQPLETYFSNEHNLHFLFIYLSCDKAGKEIWTKTNKTQISIWILAPSLTRFMTPGKLLASWMAISLSVNKFYEGLIILTWQICGKNKVNLKF